MKAALSGLKAATQVQHPGLVVNLQQDRLRFLRNQAGTRVRGMWEVHTQATAVGAAGSRLLRLCRLTHTSRLPVPMQACMEVGQVWTAHTCTHTPTPQPTCTNAHRSRW